MVVIRIKVSLYILHGHQIKLNYIFKDNDERICTYQILIYNVATIFFLSQIIHANYKTKEFKMLKQTTNY